MKKTFVLSTSLLVATLLVGCKNSAEEARILQARQDSLAQVQAASKIQARADSLAREMDLKRRALEQEKEQQRATEVQQYNGSESGTAYLQVESWRSKEQAEKRKALWIERGFPNAYVLKIGSDDSGDIWYRIRLLKDNPNAINTIAQQIEQKYKTKTWVID